MSIYDKLPPATPDDLVHSETREWSQQKHLRLYHYLSIFGTGIRDRFPSRVYVDLYSGAGKARVRETGELVLGSPLLALSIRDPFSKYILCEEDERLADALRERCRREHPGADVSVLTGDAAALVPAILRELPADRGSLSFCFVDPYDLGFDFSTIARLAAGRRMDFLFLLASQMDGQRNLSNYLRVENRKIERLLDDPGWRDRWREAEAAGAGIQWFLVERFTEAMAAIGYARPEPGDFYRVESERGVPLYYLAFYSRHPLGYKFWRESLKYSTVQRDLFG
jgi:three-Cys-motif partner protein